MYADFLEALADPEYPEYLNMLDWYGNTFDPSAFALGGINRLLNGLKSENLFYDLLRVGITALKSLSGCSFTAFKLRSRNRFRLVLL